MLDLGTLSGRLAIGEGINASGWVVGNAHVDIGGSLVNHGFLYDGTTSTTPGRSPALHGTLMSA